MTKPTGAIPRIEDRPKQLEFVRAVAPDTVMIDMYRAERLAKQGVTADSFPPDTDVILTTTFEDERLELWFLERQIEVAVEFGADMVVPCDCPVYNTHSPLERRQIIEVYVENITRACEEFCEYRIGVIPLIKGVTPEERRICYDAFQAVDVAMTAFYCAQYFLYGPRLHDLLDRSRDIVREYDPESMMLIGFQSENWLSEFPPAVQAAAGFRWFWQSGLHDEPLSVAHRNYDAWEQEVDASLRTGQALLNSFATQPTYGGL